MNLGSASALVSMWKKNTKGAGQWVQILLLYLLSAGS